MGKSDYGRFIARQRAKAKALKQSSTSAPKKRAGGKKQSVPVFETWPLAKKRYSAMPGLDWERPSTLHVARDVSDMLKDTSTLPHGVILRMPTGTGKTAVAVATVGCLQEELGRTLKAVVIAPGAIVKRDGWQKTITSWNDAHPDNQVELFMIDTPDRFANILSNRTSYGEFVEELGHDAILLIDEVHKYKSPTSKRAKSLQKLPHLRRLGLTATPFSADPAIETASYLVMGGYYRNKSHFMDETGLGMRVGYNGQFLIYDDNGRIDTRLWPGYKIVQEQRRDMFVVPDVSFALKNMPNVDNELIQLAQSDELDDDLASLGKSYERRELDSAAELSLLMRERIVSDRDRAQRVVDIVSESKGQQPLVFYFHSAGRDALIDALTSAGYGHQEVSGRTNVEDLDDTDMESPILIQYQSGSEGIEFKDSSVSIFYENLGSPIWMSQARGRNVRMGSTHDVTHYYLVADTAYDRLVFDRAMRGEELTEEIYAEIALESIGGKA